MSDELEHIFDMADRRMASALAANKRSGANQIENAQLVINNLATLALIKNAPTALQALSDPTQAEVVT